MSSKKDEDCWPEYQRLVLGRLEDHGEALDTIRSQLTRIRIDIATLKVRAGMWGAASGLITAVVAGLLAYLAGK